MTEDDEVAQLLRNMRDSRRRFAKYLLGVGVAFAAVGAGVVRGFMTPGRGSAAEPETWVANIFLCAGVGLALVGVALMVLATVALVKKGH